MSPMRCLLLAVSAASGALAGSHIDAYGNIIDADGNVIGQVPGGGAYADCTIDEYGNIIDANGNVVGTVSDRERDGLRVGHRRAVPAEEDGDAPLEVALQPRLQLHPKTPQQDKKGFFQSLTKTMFLSVKKNAVYHS